MSIKAAFMVPHPPMIVPDVGRGSESQIEETTRAYERVAEEVASLGPEVIIITSPHSVMYSDYFHISPGRSATGSFKQFRAGQVRFEEQYDTALVEEICRLADEREFPAGTMGERDRYLDHGTMVPLYFIRQKYREGRIVRIGLSGLSLAKHYELGMILRDAVNALGRRAVLIASGDLSHKLQSYGPYGFAPEGPEYDRRIMDVCGRAAFGELFDFDETFCDRAAECGHRSFVIMAGAFDGLDVKATQLSHQDVTGVGYGICTFYPGAENENRHFLAAFEERSRQEAERKRAEADAYVRLAYRTVEMYLLEGKKPRIPEGKSGRGREDTQGTRSEGVSGDRREDEVCDLPDEMLNRRAGTFVSIHENGQLRGCIGTIAPTTKNIAQEIVQNAVSAATRDPRFAPITAEELPFLDISVDVLGAPERVESLEELDVKRYGVIVTSGRKRGLLLPDLEGVDTVEEQVAIAARKGGIREDERKVLERFEVIRHR